VQGTEPVALVQSHRAVPLVTIGSRVPLFDDEPNCLAADSGCFSVEVPAPRCCRFRFQPWLPQSFRNEMNNAVLNLELTRNA
jgi:hypothetical protein